MLEHKRIIIAWSRLQAIAEVRGRDIAWWLDGYRIDDGIGGDGRALRSDLYLPGYASIGVQAQYILHKDATVPSH